MPYPFHVLIKKSTDKQFYAIIMGKNNEPTFTGETRKQKASLIKMINRWWPGVKIVDTTKK